MANKYHLLEDTERVDIVVFCSLYHDSHSGTVARVSDKYQKTQIQISSSPLSSMGSLKQSLSLPSHTAYITSHGCYKGKGGDICCPELLEKKGVIYKWIKLAVFLGLHCLNILPYDIKWGC